MLGFHAQQAVEKALKAVLSWHPVEYPRTHNLSMLVELLWRTGIPVPPHSEMLGDLIPFGVAMRYEAELDERDLQINRGWAVQAASRTVRWASDVIAVDNRDTEQER